jgi:hypothetical protein
VLFVWFIRRQTLKRTASVVVRHACSDIVDCASTLCYAFSAPRCHCLHCVTTKFIIRWFATRATVRAQTATHFIDMAYALAAQNIDKSTKLGSLSDVFMQVRNRSKVNKLDIDDSDVAYISSGLFALKAKLGRARLFTLNSDHVSSNVAFDTAARRFN